MNHICLKCGHKHEVAQVLPSDVCPACGAVYAKVEMAMEVARQIQASSQPVTPASLKEPASNPTNALQIILFVSCVLLALSTAILGVLYYQESRLNEALLTDHSSKPQAPIIKPAPAVVTAPSTAPAPSPVPAKADVLNAVTPPASLADGAEVFLVCGYEADKHGSVKVVIDRPGKAVLLVLGSYEKIVWEVEASSGTHINGILVSARGGPSVYTAPAIPVYQSNRFCTHEKDSGQFANFLYYLNELFGIQRLDAFRGTYALPYSIDINQLDPAQGDLTLEGEPPQAPLKPMKFELTTSDYGEAKWSLEGPAPNAKPMMLAPARTVKAASDQRIYQIVSHDFFVTDPATGKRESLKMPDNFPELSWPVDVTYDSKRHYVALASFGGEGFVYRFDTNTGKWLDYRSLNNIDITTFAYDEVADRYVAWYGQGLLFMGADGTPLYTKQITERLPGFKRLSLGRLGEAAGFIVVPKGDQIALVTQDGPSVGMIWYYDVAKDVAQLTYKRAGTLRPANPEY